MNLNETGKTAAKTANAPTGAGQTGTVKTRKKKAPKGDKSMRVIGITGGIGSGKSLATTHLRARGFTVYDADEMSREATAPGAPALTEIHEQFGNSVFLAYGGLNRQALAELVFEDAEKLAILNKIVWAELAQKRGEYLAAHRAELRVGASAHAHVLFFVAPLLFESGMESECDEIWLITADEKLRVRRAAARDGVCEDKIYNRITHQLDEREKELRADVVLRNNGTPEELCERIDELIRAI